MKTVYKIDVAEPFKIPQAVHILLVYRNMAGTSEAPLG